ncbi:MAG TPA: FAD-dependent monooxygenase, partial [Labilithrix sp.]|nr:FAD-dependent monooxygenase [Labilithrix sp.]
MTERFDVVVAGGGPAGLATAICAARAGLRVAVLDPRAGVIDKACGEGIMPGGVEALGRLGVHLVGFPFVGIRYADAVDASIEAHGDFHDGPGLGVRRTVLHAAMRRRALALGVQLRTERLASFEQIAGGVLVNQTMRGRWLVGADGLRSSVRRALGVERPPRGRPRLGVRRHFSLRPWTDRV